MRYTGGVDVGSTQTKAVVLDEERRIVGRALIMTGANVVTAAQDSFQAALDDAVVREADVGYVIGTGYGRYKVTFGNDQVTEISCHARGAAHLFPGTRTVLDMGGQDTKAIRVDANGDVLDFCMNDKCAAGTGRFLQAASFALEIPLGELGGIAQKATRPVKISTTCTVFAESEVLSWAAKGKKIEDILMGVHRSIAARSVALLTRVGVEETVTFTGGVARNVAMVAVLNELLGVPLQVGEDSHYMGALGAALFAMDRMQAGHATAAGGGFVNLTAGIDVGSTYTKAALLDAHSAIVATAMIPTGFRLDAAADDAFKLLLRHAGIAANDVGYVVSTGAGRYQVGFRDLQATDLTAQGRGARLFFPGTHTLLDVGGQTMKASRLDERGRVAAFRLNDKCAAGTGAFLEKTARYLGFGTDQIGTVAAGSADAAQISGVCAVFAESEVINHVSSGRAPAEILHGAIVSLVARSVQLMKRVRLESEITLVGGIMRFPTMVRVLREQLGQEVNVPPEPLAQFTAAIGAAVLGQQRLAKRAAA